MGTRPSGSCTWWGGCSWTFPTVSVDGSWCSREYLPRMLQSTPFQLSERPRCTVVRHGGMDVPYPSSFRLRVSNSLFRTASSTRAGNSKGTRRDWPRIGRNRCVPVCGYRAGNFGFGLAQLWAQPSLRPKSGSKSRISSGILQSLRALTFKRPCSTLRPRRLGLIELILTLYGCVLLPSGGGRACPDQMPCPALGAPRTRCRLKKPSMDQSCAPS